MNPPEVPVQYAGASAAGVAETRRRIAEDRCGDLVDRAWAWVESRPVLAHPELALFAAQAITLGRTPPGLSSQQLEDWLLAAWSSRQAVAA